MKHLLAIDTDPGVDDAMALMLACHHPLADVRLVTTVAGNVAVSLASRNAKRILGMLGTTQHDNAPVLAQGSAKPLREALITATHVHGDDGLAGASDMLTQNGQPFFVQAGPAVKRDGVARLIEAAALHGKDITVVALGPLTNLAMALDRSPDAFTNVKRIVVMGGAINVPGNITPVAEFNFYVDPLAADRVLGAGIPLTVVPLDVTQQVRLRPSKQRLRGRRANTMRQLVRVFARDGLAGQWRDAGMPMHDPLAVAVALNPDLVETTPMAVRVEFNGEYTRGQAVTDQRMNQSSDARPRVDVALRVDVPAALAEIEAYLYGVPEAGPSGRPVPAAPAVAVLGGCNIDQTVVSPTLPRAGETVQGADLQTGFGGKGANQALAACRAGAQTHFFSSMGQDAGGQSYRAALDQFGIHLHEPVQRGLAPTGTALICVDAAGENQIAVAPGANRRFRWQALTGADEILRNCKVLVSQLELPAGSITAAFRDAKRHGLTTIFNASPAAPLSQALQRCIDILVVNETEAAFYASRPVEDLQGAESALAALHDNGYGIVVLTLGAAGSVWIDETGIHHQQPYPVTAIDTTGAGDSFLGFLATGIAQGMSIAKAVDFASRAGAFAVTRMGAQAAIPTRKQVERLQL